MSHDRYCKSSIIFLENLINLLTLVMIFQQRIWVENINQSHQINKIATSSDLKKTNQFKGWAVFSRHLLKI